MPIRALSNELQRIAEEKLNENPARIQEDLKHIREWIQKQAHLTVRSDDQSLIGFLRGCKYSLQQTKEKIDYFYTIRSMIPEFFDNRDPFLPEIQEILQANTLVPLPQTTDAAGPRIIFYSYNNVNPTTMSFFNIQKVFFMCMDILMTEDDTCTVAGIMLFCDFGTIPIQHMTQLTPTVVRKITLCLQGTYPIGLKGGHYVNVPSAFEKIYEFSKRFLTQKITMRMHLYTKENCANVYKFIPQSLLPKEYGGESGSMNELGAAWKKKVETYREWFLEDSKYRSNEKLRPGKPKNSSDMFGVEGCFRKLDID